MGALSSASDAARVSIPFDLERSGFVMGEGSAVLVLEEMERAVARGAHIYAELAGYGATDDAHHITAPAPGGDAGAKAMSLAIEDARAKRDEVDYVNAHGTSTKLNDIIETAAVKAVFAGCGRIPAVSSTKSVTGHLLGAAGAIEAVICAKALEEQVLPPTANYRVKDPECDLDYVTDGARKAAIRYAISNSLGFGGHNATLAFKRWEGK
jgi:3-oxoacyl-[acyl-carrier-protein] synthase II